jgi:hypothetical protein
MNELLEARATKERVLLLRERALKLVEYFLKQTLYLICHVPFEKVALVHALAKVSIELIPIYFHIQIGEMAFCKPDFIIIKSNYEYFQNAQKGESFLDDFEALVREIDVRG